MTTRSISQYTLISLETTSTLQSISSLRYEQMYIDIYVFGYTLEPYWEQ